MKGEYFNFWKATACCIGFLGLYIALNSAQNIQALLFSDDGFGALGFYGNALVYLGEAAGALIAVYIMEKLGDVMTMAIGSALAIPQIACNLLPAYKA